MTTRKKPDLYTRYPLANILIYNGATIAHYVLGGIGIILGYGSRIGYFLGSIYLVFSFVLDNFTSGYQVSQCAEFVFP